MRGRAFAVADDGSEHDGAVDLAPTALLGRSGSGFQDAFEIQRDGHRIGPSDGSTRSTEWLRKSETSAVRRAKLTLLDFNTTPPRDPPRARATCARASPRGGPARGRSRRPRQRSRQRRRHGNAAELVGNHVRHCRFPLEVERPVRCAVQRGGGVFPGRARLNESLCRSLSLALLWGNSDLIDDPASRHGIRQWAGLNAIEASGPPAIRAPVEGRPPMVAGQVSPGYAAARQGKLGAREKFMAKAE